MISNPLSPDRYKYLLMATGVSESKAETARAQLELSLLQSKAKR